MKRFVISYLPQLFLALAAFTLSACQNEEGRDSISADVVKVGEAVPEFILTADGGTTISSSSLQNQVYMLSFFDTGCGDCQKELPVLQRIYDKYKDVMTVLTVPRSQTTDEAMEYWDKTGLSMPVYAPQDKKLYYKFATSGIPRTYIVSGGVVRAILTDNPLADFDTLDSILEGLVGDIIEKNTVDTSFKINVMSATRAADDYFQNEYTISHIEFFFFDAATKKFVKKVSLENLTRDEDPYDKQYDITYIINSVRLKVGVYNIFAIANYHNVPDDITDQDKFLDLVDDITYSSGVEASLPFTGAVMTSRPTSLLNVDLMPWSGKKYSFQINMERVMAKLQIGVAKNNFELSHDGRKYADINIANYKLVNLNKQYYLFQHKAEMNRLGDKPRFVLPDNFDEYTEGSNQYVIDPLFYQKSYKYAEAILIKGYYQSWYGAFSTDDFAPVPTAGNYGYAYILENTSFKESQVNGYSPGIVFKAAVSPVFVYLYDNKTRKLVEERRAEYWPNTLYLYNFNFYGSIQAINYAAGLTLDELATYTDSQLKNYGIKKCNFNMGVYETYYTYWIQHRTNISDPMGAMAYGVLRNNFYKIVVAGVSGLGVSEIVPDILRDNYPNSFADIAVSGK